MEIINYEEKEMIPLTNEETKSQKNQEVGHIWKKEFCFDKNEKNGFKLYTKSQIIIITQENLEELHIIFAI